MDGATLGILGLVLILAIFTFTETNSYKKANIEAIKILNKKIKLLEERLDEQEGPALFQKR